MRELLKLNDRLYVLRFLINQVGMNPKNMNIIFCKLKKAQKNVRLIFCKL